jgi:four helix bundle protein
MKDYKQLSVWQKTVDLAILIYNLSRKFPDDEKFGLTSQMRRAATSVPANIAEGWGRGTTKEYIQFLLIARGSLMELETHVIISRKLLYLSEEQFKDSQERVQEVGRMLNGLIHSLRSPRASSSANPGP